MTCTGGGRPATVPFQKTSTVSFEFAPAIEN